MGLFDFLGAGTNPSQNIQSANKGYKLQTDALSQYYNQATQDQNKGYANATTDLQRGATAANNTLANGLAPFQALGNAGTAGINLYGNVAGLNGPEAATAAYQGSPAYQWELSQGLQALDRNHAAAGNYNSGNWGTDAMNYAAGTASKDYFNYLNALQPYFQLGENAAAGQANIYGQQADNTYRAGAGSAALDTGLANNLTDIAGRYYPALGQAGYQNQQDITGARNTANANTANIWGGILGLGGKLLTAPATGGGSLFGNMF